MRPGVLEPARRAAAAGRARWRRGAAAAPARIGPADGARAHRAAVRSRHLRRDRRARHAPVPRLRHGRPGHSGRRRRRRQRSCARPAHLRVRAGLHRLRRVALRDQRREDRQDHGSGGEDGRADRRPERLRRRAHSGRRACRSPATPTSSCATRWRPASSRRFPPSWDRAPAVPSIRRRSPTSP